jgi:sec-independent protein translocase protein TatB
MFGMGMGELLVIAIVALLVLGPDKIPEAAKSIGKVVRELRKQTKAVKDQLESDDELAASVRDFKSALHGDIEPTPKIKPPAHANLPRPVVPPVLPSRPAPAPPVLAEPAEPATSPEVTLPEPPTLVAKAPRAGSEPGEPTSVDTLVSGPPKSSDRT